MLFSVIYDFDCSKNCSVECYSPPNRKLWQMTEGDDQLNYEDVFPKGKHRKFCAVLTRKQFDRFIEALCLTAEDVETMGSLGAPGCGLGIVPAISFRGPDDDPACVSGAYVTPIFEPLTERKNHRELTEDDWNRIKRAVLTLYG